MRLLSLLKFLSCTGNLSPKGDDKVGEFRANEGFRYILNPFPKLCLNRDSSPFLRGEASSLLLGCRVSKCTKTDQQTHTTPTPQTHTGQGAPDSQLKVSKPLMLQASRESDLKTSGHKQQSGINMKADAVCPLSLFIIHVYFVSCYTIYLGLL